MSIFKRIKPEVVNLEPSMTAVLRKAKDVEVYEQEVQEGTNPATLTPPDINYIYSSEMPKIDLNQGSVDKSLEVTIASSQDEDETLLHKLFDKLRK